MGRTNFEAEALFLFASIAQRRGCTVSKGQAVGNRLMVSGNAYYQFGDLRIDLPNMHLVVEIESAGGVTNLVKYWRCVHEAGLKRPVHLLHLFRQGSADDYRAHIDLWRFLAERMKADLGSRFHCTLFTYSAPTETELRPALHHFEHLLPDGA